MKIGLFIPCYINQFHPGVGIASNKLLQKPVERFLINIVNLSFFFLYTALKLLTIAMAMLANFALSKEKNLK
jgi:hypothetical protein